MISAGVDFSPVGHWTQGAARMMSALAGNIKQARADKAEKAGIEGAAKKFAGLDLGSLLGGGAAYPSAVAGGASPTSGAATGTIIASTPQAAEIKQGLEARGLPSHVADAFVMNFQDESGLNPGINEKNPIVPGSRGGYGLYQLTGPRRVAYEQFAQQRGVDPSNTDAQLDFLMTELQGPEARAAKSILSAPDTATAAQAIVNDFLRPAPEHRAARAAKYAKAGGVQVASLDPSIGMAQAYAAEPQPQTAAAAINQIAPQQPAPETKISDALLRQNDMALGGALAPQGQAPQQVADASGYFPAAPSADSAPIMGSYAAPRQGGVNIQQLLEAASDPWMNDAQRSVIGMALKQQMQQNDPMRALQMAKTQAELNALQNPKPIEVNGRLVDPRTYRTIADFSDKNQSLINAGDGRLYDPASRQWIVAPGSAEKIPDSVRALIIRAAQAGLKPGTPEYNQFMISGGAGGTSLQVSPDGSVSFTQGGAAKPLTEGQSKDAVFATRAEGALPLIDQYGTALTGVVGNTAGQLPGVGNYLKPEEFQKAEQAGKEFLQAILRKDTGAAITPDETAEYGSVYLPRPGDTPAVLKQKALSRTRALEALKAGMPPQAILQAEQALKNTNATQGGKKTDGVVDFSDYFKQ
nr:phage tail tip lysozyme [Brucella sp. 6810]